MRLRLPRLLALLFGLSSAVALSTGLEKTTSGPFEVQQQKRNPFFSKLGDTELDSHKRGTTKPVGSECGNQDISQCTELLEVLTTENIGFAATQKELREMCPVLLSGLQCIDDYTLRCLNPQHRSYFNELYAGTIRVIKDLCNNRGQYQKEYIIHAPCMRKVHPEYNKCSDVYHEKTAHLNEVNSAAFKLSEEDRRRNVITLCCSFQEYLQCSEKIVLETCGSSTATFTRDFLNRMAGPIVQDICKLYFFNSSQRCSSGLRTLGGVPEGILGEFLYDAKEARTSRILARENDGEIQLLKSEETLPAQNVTLGFGLRNQHDASNITLQEGDGNNEGVSLFGGMPKVSQNENSDRGNGFGDKRRKNLHLSSSRTELEIQDETTVAEINLSNSTKPQAKEGYLKTSIEGSSELNRSSTSPLRKALKAATRKCWTPRPKLRGQWARRRLKMRTPTTGAYKPDAKNSFPPQRARRIRHSRRKQAHDMGEEVPHAIPRNGRLPPQTVRKQHSDSKSNSSSKALHLNPHRPFRKRRFFRRRDPPFGRLCIIEQRNGSNYSAKAIGSHSMGTDRQQSKEALEFSSKLEFSKRVWPFRRKSFLMNSRRRKNSFSRFKRKRKPLHIRENRKFRFRTSSIGRNSTKSFDKPQYNQLTSLLFKFQNDSESSNDTRSEKWIFDVLQSIFAHSSRNTIREGLKDMENFHYFLEIIRTPLSDYDLENNSLDNSTGEIQQIQALLLQEILTKVHEITLPESLIDLTHDRRVVYHSNNFYDFSPGLLNIPETDFLPLQSPISTTESHEVLNPQNASISTTQRAELSNDPQGDFVSPKPITDSPLVTSEQANSSHPELPSEDASPEEEEAYRTPENKTNSSNPTPKDTLLKDKLNLSHQSLEEPYDKLDLTRVKNGKLASGCRNLESHLLKTSILYLLLRNL